MVSWLSGRSHIDIGGRRVTFQPFALPGAASRCQFVAERLATFGDGIKVGISWRGGGYRSPKPTAVLSWPTGRCWVATMSYRLPFSMAIRAINWQRHIETDVTVHDINVDLKNDLEGLSALLANLDLVISVDNTTTILQVRWALKPG